MHLPPITLRANAFLYIAKLITGSHGADIARRASITACRQHTDLTCETIAAIHHVADAQPAYSREAVGKHRHADPDFNRRYQQLLDRAAEAQRTAGFANANLKRALAPQPRNAPGFKYASHAQLR